MTATVHAGTPGAPYPVELGEIFAHIRAGEYGPFDDAGLPMVDYDRWFAHRRVRTRRPIGVHYTPVTIAFYGLGWWNQMMQQGATVEAVRNMRATAEWFLHHQVHERGTGGVWLHSFSMPHLPEMIEYVPGAWISAMAQGLGASLLLRAHQLWGEAKFWHFAAAALEPFRFAVKQGGVATLLPGGEIFPEEFPTSPPLHVLNGALFALLGLVEYLSEHAASPLSGVCARALAGVRLLLPRFDARCGSWYDLRRRQIANRTYHQLHIQLLAALAARVEAPDFAAMSARWLSYTHDPAKRMCHWLAQRAWGVRRRLVGDRHC